MLTNSRKVSHLLHPLRWVSGGAGKGWECELVLGPTRQQAISSRTEHAYIVLFERRFRHDQGDLLQA